jgi:uncharacterized membrane protein
MDFTSFIALAAALCAAVAGGMAWWRQRQRLAQLQGLLREAEDSRLELFDEAQTLRRQLHAGVAAPASASAEGGAALDRALDAARPARCAGWLDTQPMAEPGAMSGFQPTQPAPLPTRPAELMGDGRR